MKRSRTATLLLMGSAPLLLSACSSEPDARRSGLYTSVEACTAATHDANTCSDAYLKAHAMAEADAPRYASMAACEADYGSDQCVRHGSGASSFVGPLMTGFVLSQLLSHGSPVLGFNSSPAFRDRWSHWRKPDQKDDNNNPAGSSYGGGSSYYYGSGFYSGSGRRMSPISSAPDRAVTVSRGGFGEAAHSGGFRGFRGFHG